MTPSPPLEAQALLSVVARDHELTYAELMTITKVAHIKRARHDAWRRLRAQVAEDGRPLYTLARIGSWWNTGHPTVHKAVHATS